MKTAKKEIAALFLYCPYCNAELFVSGGSFMFTHEDLNGSTVQCPDCDRTVKLPQWQQSAVTPSQLVKLNKLMRKALKVKP